MGRTVIYVEKGPHPKGFPEGDGELEFDFVERAVAICVEIDFAVFEDEQRNGYFVAVVLMVLVQVEAELNASRVPDLRVLVPADGVALEAAGAIAAVTR